MAARPTASEPFERLAGILEEAKSAGLSEHNAMVLSTADADGRPSSRVVLLKDLGPEGLVFYTNLESRKGREIAVNPRVSLLFYWRRLDRQVVVRGRAEPVSDEEADAYFATRSRGSQLGAWASAQSRTMPSRARLVADVARTEARFLGRPVPRPDFWSGYRVVPESFEFWRRGLFRLHRRILYERTDDGGWTTRRLYP